MSIESQAIIIGHIGIDEITRLVASYIDDGRIIIRAMQRSDYKIIEFSDRDGATSAMHVFLNSYAVEDYAATFSEPSTLLTIEYEPTHFDLLKAIVGETGGFIRKVSSDPWIFMGTTSLN